MLTGSLEHLATGKLIGDFHPFGKGYVIFMTLIVNFITYIRITKDALPGLSGGQ